jgi:deoxyribodipyrimidine photo-lyase
MTLALHWFRRDLRLTDNTSLNAALAESEQVVPVYILSTWKKSHGWTGAPRQEFLCGSLASLARNLQDKGGRLIVRQGEADAVLEKLLRETGADSLHFNRDPDPFGWEMEKRVELMAQRLGVKVYAHADAAIHEREQLLSGAGTPFRIFTPYSRAWIKLPKPAPGRSVSRIATPPHIPSLELPTLAHWELKSDATILKPGEAAARDRLSRFLDGPIFSYQDRRDLPSQSATSRLSQDLRYGLLSIREVYARCEQAAAGASMESRRNLQVYISELIWREFYFQVLWHWPEVLEHEFQPKFRNLAWSEPGTAFEAWCAGQTGFPIVDAGMRELLATGFMHNRVRMITAMFLVKDLHVSWKLGERWFMQRLVDGEIASNNGGWQWSAGTGTDAAPYFRIQNPWSQTVRFDPEGVYIKQWIPELRDVPAKKLAQPPTPGLRLARSYPLPLVDHAVERDKTLALYRR